MKDIVLITHNVRSSHNIGSLLRTCDGLGVKKLYICGSSPYPAGQQGDVRLPHVIEKTTKDIRKTALGAEESVEWYYFEDIYTVITKLKLEGYRIAALEQTNTSTALTEYSCPQKLALLAGPEVTGLDTTVLDSCDDTIEIPMHGTKESFNVAVACAIALFWLTQS